MVQPAIPMSGLAGWSFLQTTYSRQLETFSDSASVKNDRAYMSEKLSSPISLDDFMSDRRLLRVTMTAFDLAGEEWKGGFIRKALEEAANPDSTFLKRLNNPAYTKFAETFAFKDGTLSLEAEKIDQLGEDFETAAFRIAVGDVDENMRLSLNYQQKIVDIAGTGASNDAIAYRILSNVPVKTVLEKALNLPSDLSKQPIEKQAEMLRDKLSSAFGISELGDLVTPDNVDAVIRRFHVMETVNNGPSALTPGYTALTLLGGGQGFGTLQNLSAHKHVLEGERRQDGGQQKGYHPARDPDQPGAERIHGPKKQGRGDPVQPPMDLAVMNLLLQLHLAAAGSALGYVDHLGPGCGIRFLPGNLGYFQREFRLRPPPQLGEHTAHIQQADQHLGMTITFDGRYSP